MKVSRYFIISLAVAGLACIAPTAANASPRSACSVLTVAEVRAIVGAPEMLALGRRYEAGDPAK